MHKWEILIVVLMTIRTGLCLTCCDSVNAYYDGPTLPKTVTDVKKCQKQKNVTARVGTYPVKEQKGAGIECDFCTIEMFAFKNEKYWLQSCDSFKAAPFESGADASLTHNMKINDHQKKQFRWYDFGDDLSNHDKFQAACRVNNKRKGFFLETAQHDAGIGIGKVDTKTKKDLSKFQSIKCACFANECNREIIPQPEDLKKNKAKRNYQWSFVPGKEDSDL